MTKIIGISGIGGAGKSVLAKELGEKLKATCVFWDDFDEISEEPPDFIEWYKFSRDYAAWKYDALAKVLKELKSGKITNCPVTYKKLIPTHYIIFDAPLGRKHIATGQYIDFLVYLDTPLDVALARRILRDFKNKPLSEINELISELEFYLAESRPLYQIDYERKNECDLILDGTLSVDKQLSLIMKKI